MKPELYTVVVPFIVKRDDGNQIALLRVDVPYPYLIAVTVLTVGNGWTRGRFLSIRLLVGRFDSVLF